MSSATPSNGRGFEHLTSEDAEILRLEAGPVVGHTLKVVVAGRPQGGGDLLNALRERVAAGARGVPRTRERLVAVPLGLAPPAWLPDPGFDVRRHVRRATPVDGGREAFHSAVARSMTTRLDRGRPLWSLELVEGLEHGRVAYLLKIHHCMADGMASMRLAAQLLWDAEPAGAVPAQAAAGAGAPPPPPGRIRLLASGLRERARGLRASAAAAARTLLSPARRREAEAELERIPATLRRELHAGRGPSPLDAPLDTRRSVAFVSRPLDELKRIGHAHGATLNDVLLAAVAGGLRGWLIARGDGLPELRVKVPVSMHHGDEGPAALGNRDSFFFVDLPLAEPDPRRRLEAVRAETAERKRDHDAETLYVLFNDLAHVSKRALRRANAIAGRPGVFSLCVSNVPGPAERRYVLGAPVEEVHTLAEVGDRHGLRVSAVSYHGSVSLGLCTDPSAVPDLDVLSAALDRALTELA